MNRKILRGVRLGGRIYTTGQEDALYQAADVMTLTRLHNKGAIEGDWLPEAVPATVSEVNALADELKVLLPIGQDCIDALIAAGYTTIDAINNASDSELKELPKIGVATVKKIRNILSAN